MRTGTEIINPCISDLYVLVMISKIKTARHTSELE